MEVEYDIGRPSGLWIAYFCFQNTSVLSQKKTRPNSKYYILNQAFGHEVAHVSTQVFSRKKQDSTLVSKH